ENTHEAIIDRSAFSKVQALLMRDTRTAPRQKLLYLFSGLLRCADCGKAMTRSEVRGCVYYFCRTYKDRSKTVCSKHSIRHEQLEAAILCVVRLQIYALIDSEQMAKRLADISKPSRAITRIERLIEDKKKQQEKVMEYRQSVYEDWKEGLITIEDYRYMIDDYKKQVERGEELLGNLYAEKSMLKEEGLESHPLIDAIRNGQHIELLSRELLIELIDKVIIYENKRIKIKLNYVY
ncbi:MAG: zinc ribbon domain-containing protein, partial [Lachnospiraceae bacterium]|nr:zinc ribbon domain-containing protein [Lachnospiraceae bacterium]